MNFYKRYMNDYLAATVQLEMVEDGAYNRLLDWQYAAEEPLPQSAEERYRLARARTAPERRAVDRVVEQFFPEGWNVRALREIPQARKVMESSARNGRVGAVKQRAGAVDDTLPACKSDAGSVPAASKNNAASTLAAQHPKPYPLNPEPQHPESCTRDIPASSHGASAHRSPPRKLSLAERAARSERHAASWK